MLVMLHEILHCSYYYMLLLEGLSYPSTNVVHFKFQTFSGAIPPTPKLGSGLRPFSSTLPSHFYSERLAMVQTVVRRLVDFFISARV